MCLVGADQSICCIVSVLDSCGICCLHNILRYFGWHPAKKFHHYVKELLRKQTGYDDITFDEVLSEKKVAYMIVDKKTHLYRQHVVVTR